MTPLSSITTSDEEGVTSEEELGLNNGPNLPSIDFIILVNNEGVCLFENQQTYEAAKFFQFCLAEIYALKEAVIQRMAEQQNDSSSSSSSSSMSSEEMRDYLREEEEEKDSWFNPLQGWSKPLLYSGFPHSNKQANVPSPSSSTIVFSRALYLQEVPAPPTHENFLTMLQICISAILFNKAVINHIRAVRHHQMGPQGLIVPLNLCDRRILMISIQKDYETSFTALQQISSQLNKAETKQFPNIDILALALFNNTGVVYLNELASYRSAAECFLAMSNPVRHLPQGALKSILNVKGEVALLCMNAWMVPIAATCAA